MNDDTTEHSVTLRLPTTVEITIRPVAIVRWLRANGWTDGPRWSTDAVGIMRFVCVEGRGVIIMTLDSAHPYVCDYATVAVRRLAEVANVEPHVMAARIVAADVDSTADEAPHNGPTPTECLDLDAARASVNFLRMENDALRAALKDALDVVEEIDGSGIMSLNATTRADMARHRAMFPAAKECPA